MLAQLIRRWFTRLSNLGITDEDKSKAGAGSFFNKQYSVSRFKCSVVDPIL